MASALTRTNRACAACVHCLVREAGLLLCVALISRLAFSDSEVRNQYPVSSPQKRPELETPAVFSFLTHSPVRFREEDGRLRVCVEHTPALRSHPAPPGTRACGDCRCAWSIWGSRASSLVSGMTRCYAPWGLNFSKPDAGFQRGLAHPSGNAQGWRVVLIRGRFG